MARSRSGGGFRRKKASNNGVGQKSQTPIFGKEGFTFIKPHDATGLGVHDIHYYASKDFIRDVVRMNEAVMRHVREGINPDDFVDLDVFSNRHDIQIRTKDDALSILQNARLVQREAIRILKNQPDISWRALAGDNKDKKDFKKAMDRFWGSTEYRLFGNNAHPTGGALNNLTSSTDGGVPIIDPNFRTSKSFKQSYNRIAKHSVILEGRLKDPNDPKSKKYDVYDTFEEALGKANNGKGIRAQLAVLRSKLMLHTISHNREPWPTSDDNKVAHKMWGSSILKAYAYGAPTNPINTNPYVPETVSDAREMFGDGFYNVDYDTAVNSPTPMPIFQSRPTSPPETPTLPSPSNNSLGTNRYISVDQFGFYTPTGQISSYQQQLLDRSNEELKANAKYRQMKNNYRVRYMNATPAQRAMGMPEHVFSFQRQNADGSYGDWEYLDPKDAYFNTWLKSVQSHGSSDWITGEEQFLASIAKPQKPQKTPKPRKLKYNESEITASTGETYSIFRNRQGLYELGPNIPSHLLTEANALLQRKNVLPNTVLQAYQSLLPIYAQETKYKQVTEKGLTRQYRVSKPTDTAKGMGVTAPMVMERIQQSDGTWGGWSPVQYTARGGRFNSIYNDYSQDPNMWYDTADAASSAVAPPIKPLQPKPSQIVMGTGNNQFLIDTDDRGIWSVNQNTPQNFLGVASKRVAAHNAVVGRAQGLVASGDPQYAQSFFTQRGNTQIRINSPTEAAVAMGYTGHSIWARKRDKDGNWRDWGEVPYSPGGRYHSLVKAKEQYGENWFGTQEEMEEFFTKHPPDKKKDISKIAKALTSLVSPVIGLAKSSATLAGEVGGAYASATGAALTENIFNTGGEGLTGALGSAGGGAGGFISGVGDSISGGGGALGGIAGNMSDGAKGKGALAVAGAALAIGGQITSAAGSAISGGWNTAVGFLKSINKAVIKIMNTSPVFEAIKNILSLAYQMAFLPAMTLLQTNLLPLFTNVLNWAVGFGQDFAVTFQKYIEPITDSFRSALNGVMEFFNSRKNDIAELLAGAIQTLPAMLQIQKAMVELIVNNKDAILETVNLTLQAMKSLVSQGVMDSLLRFARNSADFIDEYGGTLINTMVNIAIILQKLMGGFFNLSNQSVGGGGIGTALVGAFKSFFHFAEGGYVPATPGGVPAIIGEGGEGEYIIPESKMGRVGGGITINFTGNVYGMNDFKYQVRSIMNEYSTKSNYR